ncbi:MAG: diheme cytochrome c [Nitrosomonadales bacterium]|nr:diheme cytochrome c [Nitrosomonadales bacterium]
MQKKWAFSSVLIVTWLAYSAPAGAESIYSENFFYWLMNFDRAKGVKPVADKKYQDECGACHFAYQPGLLPAKSWEALLNAEALRKHFGVNAELDDDALKVIHDYAVNNAADKSYYKRSRKIAQATEEGPAPLRITELRYISRKHHNIPEKMIKGNSGVKSLSFCDKCHTQADQGVYDEDTVAIPNYPHRDY